MKGRQRISHVVSCWYLVCVCFLLHGRSIFQSSSKMKHIIQATNIRHVDPGHQNSMPGITQAPSRHATVHTNSRLPARPHVKLQRRGGGPRCTSQALSTMLPTAAPSVSCPSPSNTSKRRAACRRVLVSADHVIGQGHPPQQQQRQPGREPQHEHKCGAVTWIDCNSTAGTGTQVVIYHHRLQYTGGVECVLAHVWRAPVCRPRVLLLSDRHVTSDVDDGRCRLQGGAAPEDRRG